MSWEAVSDRASFFSILKLVMLHKSYMKPGYLGHSAFQIL